MGEGKVKVNSLDFYNVSALSTTISTLSHGQLPTFYRTLSIRASPAFTILLSIRLAYRRATQLTVYTVVPTNIPKLPKPPQAQHCLYTRPATRPRHAAPLVALLARLLPLAHDLNTTSSSALVATASAAANLCCRRPRTCSAVRPPTKSCQSCLVSCLRCRAHLFLLRPPPRLPPPRPHGR